MKLENKKNEIKYKMDNINNIDINNNNDTIDNKCNVNCTNYNIKENQEKMKEENLYNSLKIKSAC
jgi:hypothetical protein